MSSASSRQGGQRKEKEKLTSNNTDLNNEARELAARAESDIDLSDLPELLNWDESERAKFYRPTKQAVTIRLDRDVLVWFKSRGEGYQTRINKILRDYVATHKRG